MNLESKFRAGVKEHLVPLAGSITQILKKMIDYKYPNEVVSIEFQVFTDGFTQSFPVRAFFLNSNNCEHFEYIKGKATYPSPVDPGLLEIPYVFTSDFEKIFIDQDEDLDTYTLAGLELASWFYVCWENAGGRTFGINASITLHDYDKCLNLKTRKWQRKY